MAARGGPETARDRRQRTLPFASIIFVPVTLQAIFTVAAPTTFFKRDNAMTHARLTTDLLLFFFCPLIGLVTDL